MLTEPQFKVLMILFDDQGHAGWQLAEDLHKAESNLNHHLSNLVERKFIIQGAQRKSTKQKRREGNYKETPYYLNKDLEILGTIIREMVVTNRLYDTGFPFRIIETSKYIKLMKNIYKEDLNKCLVGFNSRRWCCDSGDDAYELDLLQTRYLKMPFKKSPADGLEELHSFSDKAELSLIKDKIVTEKSLKRLERWYESYLNKQREQESSSSDNDGFQA